MIPPFDEHGNLPPGIPPTALDATREKLQLLEERYQTNMREQPGDEHVRELSLRSLKGLINQLKEEIARFESRGSQRIKKA